jgi:hypothetical protein
MDLLTLISKLNLLNIYLNKYMVIKVCDKIQIVLLLRR